MKAVIPFATLLLLYFFSYLVFNAMFRDSGFNFKWEKETSLKDLFSTLLLSIILDFIHFFSLYDFLLIRLYFFRVLENRHGGS